MRAFLALEVGEANVIQNLIDRVLEIYRAPVRDASARYGWRYASVQTLTSADTVTPLNLPGVRLPVAALLP